MNEEKETVATEEAVAAEETVKEETVKEETVTTEETVAAEEEALEWGPDGNEGLTKKLAETEAKLAEMEKLRLLALAEMDNQRKRFSREMESVRNRVIQDTMLPFLQVFDHFTMAVTASSAANTNAETILQGLNMIQAEFDKAFGEVGVTLIDATGAEFDPNLHEAMAQEPSDTVPQGKVIKQWSYGCRMGDRLLKPAMVVVSSGPAEAEKE